MITGLSLAGTAAELAMERHWKTTVQQIPWLAAGMVAVALLLLVIRPNRLTLRLVRVLAVAVIVIAAVGIWEHARANYNAGPLDFRYANSWETMSEASRWWRAATKTVGPAPVLASGVLIQSALCAIGATLRHPALET